MAKYLFDEILQGTGGSSISNPHKEFSGLMTDSRDKMPGSLFIPLVGESHDAHKFVESAVENGAQGVVVHKWDDQWESLKEKVSFIKVEDTLKALQDFSKFWRQKFQGPVIGLTGSNGKTTTKDFLSQILSQ